mgnify:FL=1
MNKPERPKTKLVEVPSTNIIPERDIGMPPILETRHLGIDFGGLTAVSDFNFAVGRTEIAGLIGPNGAGKTTIFNLLTKVYQPTRGTILLDGMDTAGKSTIQVNHMGIARTFQISKPLADLTILDNVIAAAGVHEYTGMRSYFRKSHTKEVVDKAEAVLTETGLIKLRDKRASDVSLGYLRRLEIARVLVTEPELIMLDEPCAGLSNFAINEVTELVMKLKAQKKSIVLIEHNLPITMKVCDRIMVLSYGKKIAEGTPEEVKNNKQVIEAYLGEEEE